MRKFSTWLLLFIPFLILVGCTSGGNNVSTHPVTVETTSVTSTTVVSASPAAAASPSPSVSPSASPSPTIPAGTVTAMTVTPASGQLAPNQVQQLSARATFADGTTADVTSSATWTSDNPAAVTVNASGRVTGAATGSARVTATLQSISGTSTQTVVGMTNVMLSQKLAPKTVPASVDQVSVQGTDINNVVVYGPVVQSISTTNTFTNVPVNVVSLTVTYLSGGVVVGTYVQAVTLVAGQPFTVNDPNFTDAPPVASRLIVSKMPTGVTANQAFIVKITVLDQFGKTFTAATTPVGLTLNVNPTGATLGGTLTRTPVNGVATFDDVTLSSVGTGYQLIAASTGLASRVTSLFNAYPFQVGQPLTDGFIALFMVPGVDPNNLVFPGFMHTWDLDQDFALVDGGNNTFDVAGLLAVGGVPMPLDQNYAHLSWLTPLFTQAQGLVTTAVADGDYGPPIFGTYSAYISSTASSHISQAVDLRAAVGPVTLSWSDFYGGEGRGGLVPNDTTYHVIIRDLAGKQLAVAFTPESCGCGGDHTYDMTPFVGQQVQVSFEAFRAIGPFGFVWEFDGVSVMDANSTEFVTNGDFETGDFTGWTAITDPQSQNVSTDPRTIGGLQVVRTAYVNPAKTWLRYVDAFTNNTSAPITATVEYGQDVGSDSDSNMDFVPGSNNQALSNSDGSGSRSDCGFVIFSPTTPPTPSPGDDRILYSYDVTVAPGKTVYIAQFIIQSGDHSGTGPATAVNALCLDILNTFKTSNDLQDGLTPEQVANFVNVP